MFYLNSTTKTPLMYQNLLKIVLCAAALFSFTDLDAQRADYHRFFFSDQAEIFNFASLPTNAGGFYFGNVNRRETINGDEFRLSISRHNIKGNPDWVREYEIGDSEFSLNYKSLDLIIHGENLILTGAFEDDDRSSNFILQIDQAQGDVLWSNIYFDDGTTVNNLIPNGPKLFSDFREEINVISTMNGMDNNESKAGFHHSIYSDDNLVQSSETILLSDTTGNNMPVVAIDVFENIDSSLSLVGGLLRNGFANGVAVITKDTFGNVISGNQYLIDNVLVHDVVASAATIDTGLVSVGYFTRLASNNGFILKTDSLGNIDWAKQLVPDSIAPMGQIFVNDVIVNAFGEIVVSGRFGFDPSFDFTIVLDDDGNPLFQRQYPSDNSIVMYDNRTPGDFADDIGLYSGNLHLIDNDFLFYSSFGVNTGSQNPGPVGIKMDHQGASFCHDTISQNFISNLVIRKDTLLTSVSDFMSTDTLDLMELPFGYDNTVLMLLDTVYCPNEPISVRLEAFVQGATFFSWSTGEMGPDLDTLRVFEEGEYTVTVTVEEDVCYMLCDTSNITRRDLPTAFINNAGLDCEQDLIELRAGAANLVSAIWSTGDSTLNIQAPGPGTYSVIITDDCGEMASATVTLTEADFIVPFVPSLVPDNMVCENGTFTLNASGSGQGITGITEYLWSTGETTESIVVDMPGTYTVTLTSNCGDEQVDQIDIAASAFDLSFDVTLQFNNFTLCQDGTLQLVANSSNTTLESFMWSTGETSTTIDVSDPGTYSVTVVDICGEEEMATLEILPDDFDLSYDAFIASSQVCEGRLLLVTTSGGVSPFSYVWDNQETEEERIIPGPGTYSITVTDACQEVSEATITFTDADFDNSISVELTSTGECPPLMVTAEVSGFLNDLDFNWTPTPTSGQNTSTAEFEVPGPYSVTVTNGCEGETAEAVIDAAGDNLQWPNLFFPTSTAQIENQTFGPYVECPEFFTGTYKLEVFNRWGGKLFESDRIIDRWNGRKDNGTGSETVAEDVYMYVWTYNETTGSGHVTLSK